MWVLESDLAQPLCAHNWFKKCIVGLSFILGFRKINAAHQTVAAVAHSLRYDSAAIDRGIRSSPYVLFRIWQPCVLGLATEILRYLVTNTQIDAVERTLIHS